MKKHLLFTLFFAFVAGGFAQNESRIYTQLKSQETKSEIISKYRSLLMDKFTVRDSAGVKGVMDEMNSAIDEKSYVTLFTSEKWMLALWLKDYVTVLNEIIRSDSASMAKMRRRIEPANDQLNQIIYQRMVDEKALISDEIKSDKSLKNTDQQLLLLLLDVYASTVPYSKYTETINRQATSYIKDFPSSPYKDYVRRNIRFEYRPAGFSMGMECYSGASVLTGKTTDYLSSGGVFGCGFIWGYNNFQLNTRVAFVFSELNHDIDYKGYTWQKGERAQLFLPEISLGYKFMASKKVSVSPFAGFAWLGVAPYQVDQDKNADLKNIEIMSKASPVLGVDFGWEFLTAFYFNEFYRKQMSSYYSLNLRYSVQPVSFDTKYIGMNGLTHNIAISLKFGFGGAKRVL